MNKSFLRLQQASLVTVCLVVSAAVLARLIPHWPNFTPVLAMALVGGALSANKRLAIAVPLAAMAISDLCLGTMFGWGYAFHDTQVWVYGSLLATALLGSAFTSRTATQTVFVGGTLAAVMFFLVTNAAVWFSGTMYPHNLQGLAQSYAAGLAFYRDGGNYLLNGLVSTWVYGFAFIALANVLEGNRSRLRTQSH